MRYSIFKITCFACNGMPKKLLNMSLTMAGIWKGNKDYWVYHFLTINLSKFINIAITNMDNHIKTFKMISSINKKNHISSNWLGSWPFGALQQDFFMIHILFLDVSYKDGAWKVTLANYQKSFNPFHCASWFHWLSLAVTHLAYMFTVNP